MESIKNHGVLAIGVYRVHHLFRDVPRRNKHHAALFLVTQTLA